MLNEEIQIWGLEYRVRKWYHELFWNIQNKVVYEQIVQQLGTLIIALSEDICVVPNTQMAAHNWWSHSRVSTASFNLSEDQ